MKRDREPAETGNPEHPYRETEIAIPSSPRLLRFLSDVDSGDTARAVLDMFQRANPARFANGQLRTLRRRVRTWRALEDAGSERADLGLEKRYMRPHHPEAFMGERERGGRWNPPLFSLCAPQDLAIIAKAISDTVDEEAIRELLENHEVRERAQADMPMTVKQAARYLGVHEQTLRQWAFDEGLIGWYDIGREGGRRNARFYRRDLDLFVKNFHVAALP